MARTLFRAPRRRNISTGVRNTLTIDMSTLDTRMYNSLVRPRFHMLIGGILASDRVIEALLYGMSAVDPVLAPSQE